MLCQFLFSFFVSVLAFVISAQTYSLIQYHTRTYAAKDKRTIFLGYMLIFNFLYLTSQLLLFDLSELNLLSD